MLPIIDHPWTVKRYAPAFAGHFTEAGFSHFQRYLTGLIVSENKTIAGITDRWFNSPDQSSLNRFLTRSTSWKPEDIDQARLKLLESDSKLAPKASGLVVIDDTITEKSGQKIEATGWYRPHGKNHIWGHNLVTTVYTDPETTYPLLRRLYRKQNEVKDKHISFKTKIDLAIEMVDELEGNDFPAHCYLFDSWYLTRRLVKQIESHQKDWIGECKSNRTVMWTGGRKYSLKEFLTTVIRPSAYRPITLKNDQGKDQQHWYFTKSVTLKGLGRVRILALFDNPKLEGKPFILATNHRHWHHQTIINHYQQRWQIETVYRAVKQSLGLQDYQLRSTPAHLKHWCLVDLAYTLLELNRVHGRLAREVAARLETLGSYARTAAREVLRSLVFWIHRRFQDNQLPQQVYHALMS